MVAAVVGGAVIQNQKDQREHNRLSVRPALHSWLHTDEDDCWLSFEIRNNGVGPAIIDRLCLVDMKEGVEFPVDHASLKTYIQARLKSGLVFAVPHINALEVGYTLPANESVELFRINIFPDEQQTFHYYVSRLTRKLSLCVSYRSIYDEEFEAFGS